MKILKHKQDWRSVAFTFICLTMLLLPFQIDIPTVYTPTWLLICSLFCFSTCIVNHNHVHTKIFHHTTMNKLFGVLLTLAKGHTSGGVVLAHNYNHHVHNGNAHDWIRPQLAGNGPGIMRLFTFITRSVVSMARGKRKVDSNTLPIQIVRQIHLERLILLVFVVFLLILDAKVFMIFVALPWVTGVLLLIGVNLLQHDRCDPDSTYNHSRNFTGKLGNWFFFNNGYHTAHHINPGLHWNLLPDYHDKEVAPYIDQSLDNKSIITFLIKNYFISIRPLQGE